MRINKKTIISIVLCLAAVFMGVGYSILSTNLKITGGANITSTWDVRITGIVNDNATGSAYNLEEPSFTNDTARFRVALVDPGDSMTYTVTIKNQGTITAILNSLDITTSGTDAIIYEVTGLKEGDTLAAGETIDVEVVARYNSNVIADPDQRVKTLRVGLEWVQYTNQTITPGTYTINYDRNGGSGSMSSTTCTIGTPCYLPLAEFTKNGYIVDGWGTTPNGAVVYREGEEVTNIISSGKTITLYAIWIEKPKTLLVSQILSNNTAYLDSAPSLYVTKSAGVSFSTISSTTNGQGLYVTNTNTENSKQTYYFRGNVTNNIVQFGTDSSGNKLYWKIVRINEDGTIRLIYNGTSATASGTSSVLSGVTAYAVSTTGTNAYVGYMYGSTSTSATYAQTHANTNSSKIKTKLDTWYTNNLKTKYEKYIADAGFCNDRSLYSGTGIGTTYTLYNGYYRSTYIYKPQFTCPQENDLFTTASSSKGNKALSVPIGLLTVDELVYAGGTSTNTSYYLYNGIAYWTMSPYGLSGSNALMWAVAGTGTKSTGNAGTSSSMYARPVINLKANVVLSDTLPSGCSVMNGTSSCPYVIDTTDELKEVKNNGYTVTVIPIIYKKDSTTSVLSSSSQIIMSTTKQTVTSGSSATFSYGTVASYPYHSFKCNSSNVTQATGGATSDTPIAGTLTATNVTSDITCHLYFQSILLSDA